MYYFEIPGKPLPLKRARKGKCGFYDPNLYQKVDFITKIRSKYTFNKCDYPIGVRFYFHIEMPQSWSKKKKLQYLSEPHCQKPDASNLIKFVEDALNNVLWTDDCLIAKITSEKIWAIEPKTIIEVYPIQIKT